MWPYLEIGSWQMWWDNVGPCWSKVDPSSSMTGVLIEGKNLFCFVVASRPSALKAWSPNQWTAREFSRREKFGHRQTHTGRTPCKHWSFATTGQANSQEVRDRDAWNRFLSGVFRGSTAPLKTHWSWTSSLQNCETMNFYCLIKPLSLWYFVTADWAS